MLFLVDMKLSIVKSMKIARIWQNPQTEGRYDIYVDSNRNGKFDGVSTEPVNDGIEIGFEVIPEFTALTAILTLLVAGLLFFILRRKWEIKT